MAVDADSVGPRESAADVDEEGKTRKQAALNKTRHSVHSVRAAGRRLPRFAFKFNVNSQPPSTWKFLRAAAALPDDGEVHIS